MSVIRWRPWQDKLVRELCAAGYSPNFIAHRLGYAQKTVAARIEALGLTRAAAVPPLAKYTQAHDAELLRLHAEGQRHADIAAATGRSPGSVANRLSVLLAQRAEEVFTDRALQSRDENIVGQAEHILRKAGYTDLQVKVMSLDDRMRTANGILKGHHYPQLGKKPAWLHK